MHNSEILNTLRSYGKKLFVYYALILLKDLPELNRYKYVTFRIKVKLRIPLKKKYCHHSAALNFISSYLLKYLSNNKGEK